MIVLGPEKLAGATFPVTTVWLHGSCMESRGKQDLWMQQKPEVLETLWEQAIIQSVESSNRIEGVTVPPERLRPIVLGRSKPRDRSEEELIGYRKALKWIFSRKRPVPVKPETVLYLHSLAQGGHTGDAGEWKARDNEIIEILPNGERRVRFSPASAKKTPGMVKSLCDAYDQICDESAVPTLIVVGSFVFDFLCIHPFRDGNGRVSRLLTTLLLQQHGFHVGRYISLERLIEESKEDYYRILEECSVGWHDGRAVVTSWWNYFLSMIQRAYKELGERIASTSTHASKSDLVLQAINSQIGEFSLAEIQAACPAASLPLIKKILAKLKRDGRIRVEGRGRGARWELFS
jgi:Fic family protein